VSANDPTRSPAQPGVDEFSAAARQLKDPALRDCSCGRARACFDPAGRRVRGS